jgi:hypothetical protein
MGNHGKPTIMWLSFLVFVPALSNIYQRDVSTDPDRREFTRADLTGT